jgi:uncharacterized protein YigA (DUF484 family)
MSNKPKMGDKLREEIIAQPDVILEDQDLMRALVAANERAMGGNIVDLRGVAMKRLEARLERLEDTHQCVIAAAYENLAGANQVHRAILRMLEPVELEEFFKVLSGDIAAILRVDAVRLVLETGPENINSAQGDVLSITKSGFIEDYLKAGRRGPVRQVTLRQIHEENAKIYGDKGVNIRSEACLLLDFGAENMPGMLALGSRDPQMFYPQQGSDLLTFLAGVFERTMHRWIT